MGAAILVRGAVTYERMPIRGLFVHRLAQDVDLQVHVVEAPVHLRAVWLQGRVRPVFEVTRGKARWVLAKLP